MNNKLYKLGIDIGSTTVKIAILNKDNDILFSDYERHFANIRETLSSLIQQAFDQADLPLPIILMFPSIRKWYL